MLTIAGIPWLARMGDPDPPEPVQWIPYDIPLRRGTGPGSYARLVLPMDLTRAEADRVCGVIQAVAF